MECILKYNSGNLFNFFIQEANRDVLSNEFSLKQVSARIFQKMLKMKVFAYRVDTIKKSALDTIKSGVLTIKRDLKKVEESLRYSKILQDTPSFKTLQKLTKVNILAGYKMLQNVTKYH